MSASIQLTQVAEDIFNAPDGRVLQREHGLTPNGNPLNGRWVLRAPDGTFVDCDRYRHDIAERNGLRFDY